MPLDGVPTKNELDYLLLRHQVEQNRAATAASAAARKAHHGLAELYQQRIDRLKAGNTVTLLR